ncbi:hypothetical protein FA95DRAFT_1566530 [Auriscalpium vulgare]|uniref:Uncharacterized protein n=1 Tax=Auriscalpium vulgare TaxID=40419 RepID=A0ACB8R8F9_9AGAM|nr:hypothetical protein FA95DRAFT_1566530 [Auriscalpium vulgare]
MTMSSSAHPAEPPPLASRRRSLSKLMSEKAKGKQRAVDPQPPEPAAPLSRELMVRFTEGIPDLVLHVGEKDSVRDVKSSIRTARSQLHNRRLRLIHSGRLLTDGTFLYSWLTSLEERQRRANAKDALSADGEGAPTSGDAAVVPAAAASGMAFLHCSVGPQFSDGEIDEETKTQTTQIKPLRGFDRLAAAGFSEADISNFRRQFHSQSAADYLSQGDFDNDEEYEEHARALEEQWIDSIDSAGTASLSRGDPSSSAILQGIVVGFFFPLLPFFYFRETKPPAFWSNGRPIESLGSVVFTRRMQMGLVVGFLVNILFGLWRYLWGSL